MQRLKHVAAVLGLIALAGALGSFSVVTPASSAPEAADAAFNTVNITKLVNGLTPANPFQVTITCGGVGNAYVLPLTIDGTTGRGEASVDIPVGVTNLGACSVVETNRQGAPSTAMVFASPSGTATSVAGTPTTAPSGQTGTITFAQGGNQTVNAIFSNTFAPAATLNTVAVTKAVTGVPRPGSYWIVQVVCDVGPPSVIAEEVVDLVFTGAGTQNAQVPAGICTPVVSETFFSPNPPAPSSSVGALAGLAFTATGGATQTVTVTNTYPGVSNTIVVNKSLRGVVPPASQWTVSVLCSLVGGGSPEAVQTFTFPAGVAGSHAFQTPSEKPQCVVTETNVGGSASQVTQAATGSGYTVSAVTAASATIAFTTPGSTATVNITNRYPGSANVLRVTKTTTGTVPAGATYTVRVACGATDDVSPAAGQQTSIDLTFGATGGTQEVLVSSYSTPAVTIGNCTVTETANGGSTTRTFAGSSITTPASAVTVTQDAVGPPVVAGSVVVDWPTVQTATGDEAQATITNNFAPNTLRIKKQLRGDVPAGVTYTIRVRCAGNGVIDETILNFTTNSFQEIPVPANRSDCRITETVNGGAASVWYAAESATAEATAGARLARVDFLGAGGQRAKVIVRNQFPGTCPRPGPKFC